MTDEEMIYIIQHWAKDNLHFETDFVDQMEEKLAEYGSLTMGQSGALTNIIERYRIPH